MSISINYCKKLNCNCPEFEEQLDNNNNSNNGNNGNNECDLCSHLKEWHLNPVKLNSNQAEELKIRGEEVLEFCKSRVSFNNQLVPCPCPVFISGGEGSNGLLCALCDCKKNWHKWKPVGHLKFNK